MRIGNSGTPAASAFATMASRRQSGISRQKATRQESRHQPRRYGSWAVMASESIGLTPTAAAAVAGAAQRAAHSAAGMRSFRTLRGLLPAQQVLHQGLDLLGLEPSLVRRHHALGEPGDGERR